MKKRVRIYKAQEGGATQQQNISETDLMNKTYSLISEGSEPEEALNALMAAGVEQDLANRAVSAVVSYMNDEEAKMQADRDDDVEAKEDLMAEEQADADEAAREAEYESRKEALQEMYYGDDTDPGYEEEDQVMEQLTMRKGGNLPSKRTFIKNYIKQAGGSQETGRADSTGSDVRSENLAKFVGTLKNTGNQALMKEDAEAMYSAMQAYQDGGDVESGVMDFDPYHNLAHYSDTFEHAMPSDETGMFRAQFGGNLTRGQQRRMNRRFNRILGNMPMGFYSGQQSLFPGGMNIYTMGNMPTEHYQPARGSYYGGIQLANIDVRRTGLFGRPKEYTINFFNPTPTTTQDISNVIRQEENNITETVKEKETEKKEDAVNTSTEKNEKVQETASKETPAVTTTATTGGGGKIVSTTIKKPVQSLENKDAVEVPVSKKEIVKVIATPTAKDFAEYQRKKYADNAAKVKANAAKVAANKAKVEANRTKVSQQKTGITPIPIYSGEINPFIPNNPLVQKVGFFQSGGFVDVSNPELYKFIYGGSDDLAVPTVPGKLTDDPYFEDGGLIKAQKGLTTITDRFGNTKKVTADEAAIWQKSKVENPDARLDDVSFASEAPVDETETETETVDYNQYYPDNNMPYYMPRRRGFLGLGAYGANPVFQNAGMWAQQQGLPYDPRTGQVLTSIPSNLNLQSIDVKKSGLLSGLPKKYTMYFEGQGAPGNAIDKAYTPGTWYKGSDGQMHYTGGSGEQGPASEQTEGKRNKLANFLIKSRIAPGLGADMLAGRESFSEPEASSYDPTGLSARQRRQDERYKKQFGHYPGEGRAPQPEVNALPIRSLDTNPSEGMSILPGTKAYKGNLPYMSSVNKMPFRNTSEFEDNIARDIIPGAMSYQGMPLAQEDEEVISAPFNATGPIATEEDMAAEYQLPQDPRVDYANELLQLPYRPGPGLFDGLVNYNNIYSGNPNDIDVAGMYGSVDPMFAVNPRVASRQRYNVNRFNDRRPTDIPTEISQAAREDKPSAEERITRKFDNDKKNTNRYISDPQASAPTPESSKAARQLQRDRELLGLYTKEYGVNKGKKMFLKDNPQLSYVFKKYGGILAKAQDGLNVFSPSASDIPPGYFKDPTTGLIKNLAGEVYQPKSKLPSAQGMLTNDFQYKKNPLTQEAPAIKMGQDGNYENTGLLTEKDKQDANKQQMAVDVKNQNAVTVDFQAGLDQVNKYGNMFAQMLEGKDNADKQRKLYDQLVAENIYGSTNVKDRGTYDINSGLFKQDEMGFTGVVKYGGNIMQEGGYMDDEDYYGYEEDYQGEEGEETYMTPEEIEEFFANGGDLEFI